MLSEAKLLTAIANGQSWDTVQSLLIELKHDIATVEREACAQAIEDVARNLEQISVRVPTLDCRATLINIAGLIRHRADE